MNDDTLNEINANGNECPDMPSVIEPDHDKYLPDFAEDQKRELLASSNWTGMFSRIASPTWAVRCKALRSPLGLR